MPDFDVEGCMSERYDSCINNYSTETGKKVAEARTIMNDINIFLLLEK